VGNAVDNIGNGMSGNDANNGTDTTGAAR